MKEFFDITVLAVLQGVAEFLPISSSGHLVILQHILEVPEELRIKLEVFLHAGTLLAVFAFYRRPIGAILANMFAQSAGARRAAWSYAGKIAVSALPAVAVYFMFRHDIEALVENARMVGALLMFTGAILLGTRYLPRGERPVNFLRALVMGLGQAIALLPGVSRSGMTLAAARGGRVGPSEAAEFSFLMSAPLIMGGVLLEFIKGEVGTEGLSWGILAWGVGLSAVVGYFSLALLLRALKGRWFWLFGPYCIVAGLLTLIFC
ncbi:MAG: undecaprenyl-diphosphate phosphatase [Kiritimatiellae bacterium]|nr:undecaprenyl-diphosphate phosphatase [Kiritimatiellia bacterium]